MSRLPQTSTSLLRYLRQQKRVTTRLANSTPYALSGTSVTAPGLMKVDERLVAGDPTGSRVELDEQGLRKYAADGTTVQVDLTGEVAAFSGLITGSEIIGGVLKTASSGERVEIVPIEPIGGVVKFYTGSENEVWPGEMGGYATGSGGEVYFASPVTTGGFQAFIVATGSTARSEIGLLADYVYTWCESFEMDINTLELGYGSGGASCLIRRIFVVANATQRAALVAAYTDAPRNLVIDSAHPLFIWKADEAAGAQLQYTVDGTTFATIGGGGSGGPLFADPNADRLVFWDDSAGAFAALTASTGLALTGTDLTVRAATDALMGGVELATTAEAVTGTDTARAVTPAGVKAAIGAAVGAWTAPTLLNSWANYGSGQQLAQYRKTAVGDVELRGNVRTGGSGVPVFTLPSGHRPLAVQIFFGAAGSGIAVMGITTAGEVLVLSYAATGSNENVTLAFRFSTL